MDEGKIQIGLVDDHQLILDGLKNLLNSVENYKVAFTENNAHKALEYMEKHPIDLIITDVAMPEMNGVEFVRRIRQTNQRVKIMVLSMYHTDLVDENLIDGYILKESSGEDILKNVADILTKESTISEVPQSRTQNVLSKRESEIVVEIAKGLSSEQIAEKLFLSYYTVETHKKNIFLKLDVKTNAELIKKAMYIGIIT